MARRTRYDPTARSLAEIHTAVQDDFPENPLERRDHLKFYREHLERFLDEEKGTTIRYTAGQIDVPGLKVMPISLSFPDSEETVEVGRVEVTGLTVLPFGELTSDDAERDGFERLSDLIGGLTDIYGDIADDHPVTIYELIPVGPRGAMRERMDEGA